MKEPLERAKPEPIPGSMRPMEIPKQEYPPFDQAGWFFEIKFDGYRMLTRIAGKSIRLFSHDLDTSLLNRRAESITPTLQHVPHHVILDGELVVEDENGWPSFALVHRFEKGRGTPQYYVFDILHLDGYNLTGVTGLTLRERKAILREAIPEGLPNVHYVDFVEEKGTLVYEEAKSKKLEGVVAKAATSLYFPGEVSPKARWRKIRKNYVRHEWDLTPIFRP